MKAVLLFIMLFQVMTVRSQCDKTTLESREFVWKKAADALPADMGKGIARARTVVQQAAQLVQQLYPKPLGGEISWYGYYNGIAPAKQPVSPYNANIQFYPYLCAGNTAKRSSGYTASVFICVNGLGDIGTRMTINKKEYTALRAVAPDQDGYYYFNLANRYDPNSYEAWLLTTRDKFPFVFMTREEYLDEMRIATTAQRDQVEPVLKGYYQKLLDSIDHYLAKEAGYLSEPAQVLNYSSEFNGFAEGKKFADPGRSYIIKSLRPDYFTAQAGNAIPLYMTVVIRHLKEYLPCRRFYDAVKKPVLLEQLTTLLGR